MKRLDQKLAPGTVEVVYRYVVAIFRAAAGDKLIPESPCVNIKIPRQEPNKVVPFTIEQVEKMAEAMAPRYRAMVILAAGSGLRQGECFGLTVDRVDFLRRTVTVDRQVVVHAGSPPHLAHRRPRPATAPCRFPRSSSTPWPPTWPPTRRDLRAWCSQRQG